MKKTKQNTVNQGHDATWPDQDGGADCTTSPFARISSSLSEAMSPSGAVSLSTAISPSVLLSYQSLLDHFAMRSAAVLESLS